MIVTMCVSQRNLSRGEKVTGTEGRTWNRDSVS